VSELAETGKIALLDPGVRGTSAISDTHSGALTVFNLSGKLWGPKLPNSAVCLPIAYLAHPLSTNSSKTGAPEKIRTSDLCLRRAALYPAELRAHSALHSLRGRQRQRWMRRGGACDKVKVQTFSRAQSPPGRDRTAGEGPAVHRQQGGRRPGSAFRILRPRKGLTIGQRRWRVRILPGVSAQAAAALLGSTSASTPAQAGIEQWHPEKERVGARAADRAA
jgi:hypothetical protein